MAVRNVFCTANAGPPAHADSHAGGKWNSPESFANIREGRRRTWRGARRPSLQVRSLPYGVAGFGGEDSRSDR
jgi:hypothetical protein